MKAFIITITNDGTSFSGARRCINSIEKTNSWIEPFIFQASTPTTMKMNWDYFLKDIKWTYPEAGQTRNDLLTGLKLTGYQTNNMEKVKACLLSHVRLWKLCIELDQIIMILEHDAAFTRSFKFPGPINTLFTGGILGLNSPLKATRKASVFHNEVVKNHIPKNIFTVSEVPWIDAGEIPQGLAGNSAYIIKPFAAKALLNRMKDIGAWPNDALMCKQQFPWLQVIYPYFTEVQGLRSTTTL